MKTAVQYVQVEKPDGVGARTFAPKQTIAQIGWNNVLAISGGRVNALYWHRQLVGVELPVSSGYVVRVYLSDNDLYLVQRVWRTRQREVIKGQEREVYFDQVGDVAYRAGMFRSTTFGQHCPV